MAISPRMLAVIQKIEAADAEHFARLRKSAKQDKETKALAKTRAAVRSAEAHGRQEAKGIMTVRRKEAKGKVIPADDW